MRNRALHLTVRVGRLSRVLAVLLGLQAVPAFSDSVYVPLVITVVPQASPNHPVVAWLGTLTLTNPTDAPLTFRHLRVFGGPGAYMDPLVVNLSFTVPPHDLQRYEGDGILARPATAPDSSSWMSTPASSSRPASPSPSFVSATGTPTLRYPDQSASPRLRCRRIARSSPPTAVAASGDIALPTQFSLDDVCHVETEPVYSRVNVTILNAGEVEATATVRYASGRQTPHVVTVPAGAVRQLNDVFPGTTYQSALLVSATQPFLAYASTVVSWSDPGRAPAIAVVDFRGSQ